MAGSDPTAVVLVPLKAFASAKSRLSAHLSPAQRVELSRDMASRVIAASAPGPCVVVCDDDEVAAFARDHGAAVHWAPGVGLNGALSSAITAMTDATSQRVVIAAGDLPFAHDLGRPEILAGCELSGDAVVVIGDRHRRGTNVLSFTTARPLAPSYGPGSLLAHLEQARSMGLVVHEIHDAALSWDIDTPEDLVPELTDRR